MLSKLYAEVASDCDGFICDVFPKLLAVAKAAKNIAIFVPISCEKCGRGHEGWRVSAEVENMSKALEDLERE